MKRILLINGSTRMESANGSLLSALPHLAPDCRFKWSEAVHELPLFVADQGVSPPSKAVTNWRDDVRGSNALIISTPAYLNNIPAKLKNALEWLTVSGELDRKRVLPITFTPHAPRGEKAMQSLLWSLGGLNAQVVCQVALYQNEVGFNDEGRIIENEYRELLAEAITMLVS